MTVLGPRGQFWHVKKGHALVRTDPPRTPLPMGMSHEHESTGLGVWCLSRGEGARSMEGRGVWERMRGKGSIDSVGRPYALPDEKVEAGRAEGDWVASKLH